MIVTSLHLATTLMIASLEGSQIDHHDDHLVVRTAQRPDFWWGNFVALAQRPTGPSEVADWVARFQDVHPGARHATFAIDEPGEVDPAPWTRHGLRLVRTTALSADASTLRPPPYPATDAVCRPLASDEDWTALAELKKANQGDIPAEDYAPYVDEAVSSIRHLVAAGHGQWWGAFLDGRLASTMGLFTDGRGLARYQSVDTHPTFRRRGLAGTLAFAVGSWGLASLGTSRLVIVADTDDEAIRVYRSIGFVDTETVACFERGPHEPIPALPGRVGS